MLLCMLPIVLVPDWLVCWQGTGVCGSGKCRPKRPLKCIMHTMHCVMKRINRTMMTWWYLTCLSLDHVHATEVHVINNITVLTQS